MDNGNISLCVRGSYRVGRSVSCGQKKYGLSGRGNIGSFIGAIAGAILGVPFLFGIGALIGGILGAYVGGLVFELLGGKTFSQSRQAALGAMLGKLLGIIAKLSAGIGIIVLTYYS